MPLAVTCCIGDIRYWMIKNKLKINDDKTEFLILNSPHSKINIDCNLHIGNVTVTPSSSCRNLGVLMDCHLKMDKHISNVCCNMIFYLRRLVLLDHY